MERSIKKTTGKLLAGFLAVLMVFSMFTTILCELDLNFLRASASGDDTDVLHTNTAYSNTDYSVLTGNVALVGCGFGKDISADLNSALGSNATVSKYADAAAVLADKANVSLVVYACGTSECVEGGDDGTLVAVTDYKAELTDTVKSFKAAGLDVLLVTPGPITEYGEEMYYATHSSLWTPESVAAGDNISNRLKDIVGVIEEVADATNVGILSVYGKAKLSGEAAYMTGSADGIYPADYGYDLMTRWIAEYVAEHYVLARETVKGGVAISGTSTVIELDDVTNDVDAIVLTFAENSTIPSKVSVQTTKAEEDQWFEAVADVEIKKTEDGIYTASLVFGATTAKYIRITAKDGEFANVTAGVYKTALVNPVVTYPVKDDDVSTKYAFNIEWSAVAGADRYDVIISDKYGNVLKKFTTSEDAQAIPAGLLVDGTDYNVSVTSIRSGYVDAASHSGNASSGVFSASKTAPYKGNSETVDENVSSGKLVSIGAQGILSTDAAVNVVNAVNTTPGSVLTDGALASYADEEATNVLLHQHGSNSNASVTINLGSQVASITGVFFDVGFFAANHSANAKPVSVIVSYSADGVDYSSGYEMTIGTGVRTIALARDSEVRGNMTRYGETRGYSNVQFVKIDFTFSDQDNSNFYLDEVHVIGAETSSGVISRDGATILNEALVGANQFRGNYTSGLWVSDPNFAGVAALGASVPVELFVNLNADMHNNAISYGNHVITALDIAYAVDVDAIRPSSIVISVQKEGETTWTEVGGKVYVTHGTVSAENAEYVFESIPLTMADGSDVEAAYVKITLYSNINNSSVPASYTSTGKWGKWFALSHLDIRGGLYIGSIEADGATAAYHANYLQNTALVGRNNFGDINNTDIWNTISWKTAAYTTANSGYLESTGNITVGKIYWASENDSSSATGVVVGNSPSALNPDAGNVEVKADTNLALDATYKYIDYAPYTSQAYSTDNGLTTSSDYSSGKLNDDTIPPALAPSNGSCETWAVYITTKAKTINFKLSAKSKVNQVTIYYYFYTNAADYGSDLTATVSTSSDGNSFTAVSNATSVIAQEAKNYSIYVKSLTVSFTEASANYVRIVIGETTSTRCGVGEIKIMGEEIIDSPVNVAKNKEYKYPSDTPRVYGSPAYSIDWDLDTNANATVNTYLNGLLTDGNCATSTAPGSSYTDRYVVFTYAYIANPVVTVNLGQKYSISSVVADFFYNTTNGAPNITKLEVSTDGTNFTAVAITQASLTPAVGQNRLSATLNKATDASYVRFTFASSDSIGRLALAELEVYGQTVSDTTPPVISDVKITEVTSAGYRVTATVTDDVGVTRVAFPSWTNAGANDGHDDIIWHEGTKSGDDTYTCYISTNDHNGEFGEYTTHIYAYDAAHPDTGTGYNAGTIVVPEPANLINLAPYGTYAYYDMLPGNRIAYEGSPGAAMSMDYEYPDYEIGVSNTSIAAGGVGQRNELGKFAKGKLNDGQVAIYNNGYSPYRWMGFYQRASEEPNGMTIVFDLGTEYTLNNIYFRVAGRNNAANAHSSYTVTYSYSTDNSNWVNAKEGNWAQDGTLPLSSSDATEYPVYKNSTVGPSGTYRYVRINIDNNSGNTTDALFFMDEVFIYGFQNGSSVVDDTPRNWAHVENGGQYKGEETGLNSSASEDNWTVYHNGKLNDGYNVTTANGEYANTVGYDGTGKEATIWFKLDAKVDITDIKVYVHPRSSTQYLNYVEVKVSETEMEYDQMEQFGYVATGTLSGTYTKVYTVEGEGTGRYVAIKYQQEGYVGYIIEIEINGVKSANLDAPIITSHYPEQEIGVITDLNWNDVVAGEEGVLVSYDITVTDSNGDVLSVVTDHSTSQYTLTSQHFALGEGYYTITVTSKANGWKSGTTVLPIYYAPKYILTFKAPTGAQLKSSGQTAQTIQIGVYEGSAWNSDDVLGAISGVVALPYTSGGKTLYFNKWVDADGNEGIPTEGTVSANYTFTAQYSETDNVGTQKNTLMTDGKIYDGRGSVSDYYFTFTNTNQSYDYVIIDLGDIYYSLTEFDVSFYAMNGVVPFQITFEVSSKVYVPTIAQGAAFDASDWQYVSVVQSDEYAYDEALGRYSFSDEVKHSPIIDGAFGRYVKVTFYYDTNCAGVYVDEIMVSGSGDHEHTNIAEEKVATVGGVHFATLTDGYEDDAVTDKEFIVEFDDVKAGITSFQLIGADNASASFSISAGGDNFVLVETLTGVNNTYTLSDKVSARRVKIELAEDKTISEIRIYGDPGLENYYYDSGVSAEIALRSNTITLDNLVSIKAVNVDLYGTDTAGTKTGSGAMGSDTGFSMTDGVDIGYANGVSYVTTSKGRLWYGLYTSKKGINNYINATFVTQWDPTLDSTAVDFVIGSKTYKFEFNGDVAKGFVILAGGATPYSYNAVRADNSWTVEFSAAYTDVSASNIPSALSYKVTAYEGGTSVGGTDTLTYNANGTTTGWNYNSDASSWTTLSGYAGDVVAWMELDRVYYGLNTFAISVLDAQGRGYAAPNSIRFQVSLDNNTWTDVGYVAKEAIGDYRYYNQYQPSEAYVYNFSVNFEGISAKYVRAIMEVSDTSKNIAVQEFYANALSEALKISGGSTAANSFDYKMLWDDDYLYIALQYEEDEVPFYSASHDYYETFVVNYDTNAWNQSLSADHKGTNAFAKGSLMYDADTGFFQLKHDITRLGDANTTDGYSNANLNNIKLYKVNSIRWNQGYDVSDADFMYGDASLTSTVATSTTNYVNDASGKPTLDSTSVLNGYIIVCDGYAMSQDIAGDSLAAKPITVNNNVIPSSQITNDMVWFFESSDLVTEMTEFSKSLGDYLIYGFRYETSTNMHADRVYFDGIYGMEYNKYYLTRAYQGLLWENVYTFPRDTSTANTLFNLDGTNTNKVAATVNGGSENVNHRNYNSAPDINWNVKYDSATQSWSFYVHSQGTESYNNYYDNVDGRSSFRLFMSVANLNDTARYDYGNYDFVLDTYILDDATITLTNGEVIPVNGDLSDRYKSTNNQKDVQTAWDGYKSVEFKATALGMTSETNEFKLDVTKLKGKAKMDQSVNGQSLITVEIAIPFKQLGFSIEKNGTSVTKWGNHYTKMGIEKPLGKRTLMQFDSDYLYTSNNTNVDNMTDVDEFYYYVDASEFGYVLQMAPEGKGYQDLSYTDGEGYSTISSVRGEVLNTTNGNEIQYTPTTFDISKIHTTNNDPAYATLKAELNNKDAFRYEEKDGIYYFTSQLIQDQVINQGGNISTEIMIPAGGAYFSFDWKVQAETSDTLSVWLEQTDTWNAQYDEWIETYNCGIPYKYIPLVAKRDADKNVVTDSNGNPVYVWDVDKNGVPKSSQKKWTGVQDYADTTTFNLYSEVLKEGYTSWIVNGVDLKNDACMAFISGYQDNTRNPEETMLASWKEGKRSVTNLEASKHWNVNVDDVLVFSPIVDGSGSYANGAYRHVWDWNNVTMWIPNTTDSAISYTVTWMYWKNGSLKQSYNASDGRGTDDAQITNFRLSTTDELGYWKTSENWDTLRLDATVADPTDTMLGVKDLASAIVKDGEKVPAINATTNNPKNPGTNTFGESEFLTLSYAAIAATEEVGTTTKTTNYFQTKNRINISASNVPANEIEDYINNAIVFTQEYDDHLSNAGALYDWTILELVYNTSYNTWVLTRLFEEGVDKSKFNIYADNNTIIIALNYTYDMADQETYGLTRDAVLFGYANREVLQLMTPAIRYKPGDGKVEEVIAADNDLVVTQLITSNIFIRENYNVALGKTYSLRNYPTYWDNTYMYTENWFRENNTEDALAAFLAVYSETPLYYVDENKNVKFEGAANTDGDYREAFKYYYSSDKVLRFDTNQYGNVLYVPAGVGMLTDGSKMSVYSNTYFVETLEDYAIGYFVIDGMGTPDADVVEDIDPNDTVYSYIQTPDLKHDEYEVAEDIRVREENVIIDLGSVEYGLSAFKLRFLGGGEDGVVFPTSVEFAISTDGLSYSYIGSVALDDTGYNSAIFDDAYASIIYTGATDTIYGNTAADYTFDLQTVGVTARYIKATIMNHSAQNAKTFVSEFQVIQNAIYPDILPNTNASTWVDVSEDAILMYQETLERWDNILNDKYSFALAPTQAGYLFAEDEGYADDGRANTNTNTFLNGQLTDGIGGTALYQYNYDGAGAPPKLDGAGGLKEMSVGWMKAYAAEVSLTFDMGEINDVGYVSVYALESKDSVDKITMPYNVTAYVSSDNATWRKVATVNAKDNDSSEVSLKGLDLVLETDEYIVYRYNLTFARDGELGLQLNDYQYVKVVAETDGGEDGWICLTEVEVFEGHPCYPVIDLTDDQYKKNALGLSAEEIEEQDSEVRPTFFRGYYDKADYYKEHYEDYYKKILDYYFAKVYPDQTIPETYTEDVVNALSAACGEQLLTAYDKTVVYNDNPDELYTTRYVFGNVEQRAIDGRGVPYFYDGDQLLLRVTTDQLSATEYNYKGDWVSTYKLLADSRIYYSDCKEDGKITTRVFTTTAVPTPLTICNVLARDKFTCETPDDYLGEDSYYYLPIYLMNSLDYLKAVGYNVDKAGQPANYISMPMNKVELTGTVKWDTNYESSFDEYANDKNGVSLNIAPLGAKTNLGTVTYNDKDRNPETTLRFGSIWYIDDAAYYNTHTHKQQYGTLIMTLNNLSRYLTDTYPSYAKYTSVFEDYGLKLTELNAGEELTGVEEITGLTEVVKLTGVTEVIKLSGVTETDAANAKFTLVVEGVTKYYTCDDDITVDAANNIGKVWASGNNYFYCINPKISSSKYTTTENGVTKYWYCDQSVDRANWVDANGHWYCADESVISSDNVSSVVLSNGDTVYYYTTEAVEKTIKIMSRDTSGTAHYWTANENYKSWTYTTVEGNTTRYWYSDNFEGIAGGVVVSDGKYYATESTTVYNGMLTTVDGSGNTRYWSARNAETFEMLSDLQTIINVPADYNFDEEEVMAGVERFLEYANHYGNGKIGQNYDYLSFGGIVQHSRANKYYYYSNISTNLVPDKYDGNANDPFHGVDSNPGAQNMSDLLGVYNYDHRYLEFDAIIAGIPASQKGAKIVAIPYAIYANNYEFLEFGEHLGTGDAYVEDTWHNIFQQFYGSGNSSENVRYFVYGGAIARSINDVLNANSGKQYD